MGHFLGMASIHWAMLVNVCVSDSMECLLHPETGEEAVGSNTSLFSAIWNDRDCKIFQSGGGENILDYLVSFWISG